MRFSDVILQHGRALEWLTSAALMSFALTLWFPGDTLDSRTSSGFIAFGITEITIAVPLALVSGMRMAALIINGMWRRSPLLRMVGAIFGLMCFSCLTLMIAWPYFIGVTNAPSTGIGTYALLAVADFIAAYRSGADVGNSSRTH